MIDMNDNMQDKDASKYCWVRSPANHRHLFSQIRFVIKYVLLEMWYIATSLHISVFRFGSEFLSGLL
jgi:hypothetical protein